LLGRLYLRLLSNILRQMLREQPLKLIGSTLSILLIWVGLYVLLVETFKIVRKPVLEGIVATPLIFTFFFLALSAMLAFSSAILAYGGLFRRPESAFLLTSPLHPRDMVVMRYLESLALASWSLLLMGLPLMMAIARIFDEPWTFYPLFLGLFVLFIPLPGSLGLLLAWLIAMTFPKTPRRAIVLIAALLAVIGGWWIWNIIHAPVSSADWLQNFYDRVALVQNACLPHTWVSRALTMPCRTNPHRRGSTCSSRWPMRSLPVSSLWASSREVSRGRSPGPRSRGPGTSGDPAG